MIATINGLPVYNALITDEDTGMFRISLVDDPAVMSNFLTFSNEKKMMQYAITDDSRRLVRGVVMRCDFPIFRRDERLGEYYIIYKAEEIRKMAEKYLLESRQNEVNLMHTADSSVEDVNMVQYFIKGDGVSVEGFDDCADGSLIAEFHVVNDSVWEEIKKGTFKGFSLEGVFELEPEESQEETDKKVDVLDGAFSRILNKLNNKKMSKLSRFKEALAKALAEFGNVTTDKGILSWDGEDDLKIGDVVYFEDEEGNRTTPEDGDYTTEDNKVIVVEDGKVAEIKDAEAEVAPEPEAEAEVEAEEEEPIAEAEDKVAELEARIAELEAENEALKAENEELKGKVAEMQKMSLAKPAHAEMQTSAEFKKTGVKGLDNLSRILSAK